MKEWVEGKLRSSLQIESLLAPGNLMLGPGPSVHGPSVQSDAGGSLLVEGFHIAVKALFAHHQPGFSDKFFW